MKNYSAKKKIFTAIAVCFSVFLIVGIAYAAYVYNEGVRVNSTASMDDKTEMVDTEGTRWNVRNTTGLDYFIPNKTQAEFNSFRIAAGFISNLDVCNNHDYFQCENVPVSHPCLGSYATLWYDSCDYEEEHVECCCGSPPGVVCLGGTGSPGSYCNRCAPAACVNSSGNCTEGLCANTCSLIKVFCIRDGGVFSKVAIFGGACITYNWTCTCP